MAYRESFLYKLCIARSLELYVDFVYTSSIFYKLISYPLLTLLSFNLIRLLAVSTLRVQSMSFCSRCIDLSLA